ncbi:MAG: metalloprotease, partial [Acidimicrobiales bacterium]
APFSGLQIGGGGVRFTLFGFPVRMQVSFFVVVVILGLFPGATASTVLIWTAVAAVSILWHELGHAFAAKRLGSNPTIDLYSFGGLTHWQPRADASRWNLISVALAGPIAGVVLGLAVAAATVLVGGVGTGDVRFFVVVTLWINLGWGLVNLLPVLPLDGGHVLAELLPGTREQRWRRAAIISVVTGVAAAVLLILVGFRFAALVFGWAVFTNISSLRAPRKAAKQQEQQAEMREILVALSHQEEAAVGRALDLSSSLSGNDQAAFKLVAIETAAVSGHGPVARRLLEQLPGQVPPGMYALVVASETYGQRGVDELEEIFHRDPGRYHARWLAFGLHAGGRLPEIVDQLHRVPPTSRDDATIEAAAGIAEWAGDDDVARQVRSLVVG